MDDATPPPAPPPEEQPPRTILPATLPEQCNDIELLALTLGHQSPRRAARLLSRFQGIHGLSRASLAELQNERMGKGALQLQAALELGKRALDRPLRRGVSLDNPVNVVQYLGGRLILREQEEMHVVGLDVRHRVLTHFTAAIGCAVEVSVNPGDIFRPLIRHNAQGCIIVHNHPSGDPAPSDEDRELTRALAAGGTLVGVRLVDHVIIASGGSFSFQQSGGLR